MAAQSQPLIVIGHKNPDTDSICSAIAYARFKTVLHSTTAVPHRAGNINEQTAFVLARFGVAPPALTTNVAARIADIMVPRSELTVLGPEDTIGTARSIITTNQWAFLPVADGRCLGKITAVRLAGLLELLGGGLIGGHQVSIPSLVAALDGRQLSGDGQQLSLKGQLKIGSATSQPGGAAILTEAGQRSPRASLVILFVARPRRRLSLPTGRPSSARARVRRKLLQRLFSPLPSTVSWMRITQPSNRLS